MEDLQRLYGTDNVRNMIVAYNKIFEKHDDDVRIEPQNFVYFDKGSGTFRKRKIQRMSVLKN